VKKISRTLRRLVRRQAHDTCEYCQSTVELTGQDFTVDHIIPESRGGGSGLSNLCWCCFWCNSFKQVRTKAMDPKTGNLVALYHPRQDSWLDHFRWSPDATRIVGRTPIGRATVKVLRLNRPPLVAARRIWVRHELHPPEIIR
jgi:5-methylcytosine-specific restriction endonuclease McrA